MLNEAGWTRGWLLLLQEIHCWRKVSQGFGALWSAPTCLPLTHVSWLLRPLEENEVWCEDLICQNAPVLVKMQAPTSPLTDWSESWGRVVPVDLLPLRAPW